MPKLQRQPTISRNDFFQLATPATQDDIDTLIRRAADAEDHLRREVASSQALIEEAQSLRAEAAAHHVELGNLRKLLDESCARADELKSKVDNRDLVIAELHDNFTDANEANRVLGEAVKKRDATLESWSLAKNRDISFITDLRARMSDRDAIISENRQQLHDAEATNRGLLATLAARDQAAVDNLLSIGNLRELIKDREHDIVGLAAVVKDLRDHKVTLTHALSDAEGEIADLRAQLEAHDDADEALVDNS